MTIDERLEALAMNLELLTHGVESLRGTVEVQSGNIETLFATAKQDGENIRVLARIADMHERRLTRLEDGERQ